MPLQELLNKDNSVSIHHRNLQVLATEMFKIHRGLSSEILRETFVSKTSSYNLRRKILFKNVKCTLYITVLKPSETFYSFKLKNKELGTL